MSHHHFVIQHKGTEVVCLDCCFKTAISRSLQAIYHKSSYTYVGQYYEGQICKIVIAIGWIFLVKFEGKREICMLINLSDVPTPNSPSYIVCWKYTQIEFHIRLIFFKDVLWKKSLSLSAEIIQGRTKGMCVYVEINNYSCHRICWLPVWLESTCIFKRCNIILPCSQEMLNVPKWFINFGASEEGILSCYTVLMPFWLHQMISV